MTKRPTTTTALSANFQASNALSPLLRMQHSALRRRTTPAAMRHPAEEPESSASSRSPVPFNGSDSHRTVRAVFCFSAATGHPLRRFCRRVAAIIVGTATANAQQAQPNSSFGRSPSRCLRCERPRPGTTPRRPPHREADAKCRRKKGSIGQKRSHLFAISHNFFEQVPVHGAMCPDNAYDQPTPRHL